MQKGRLKTCSPVKVPEDIVSWRPSYAHLSLETLSREPIAGCWKLYTFVSTSENNTRMSMSPQKVPYTLQSWEERWCVFVSKLSFVFLFNLVFEKCSLCMRRHLGLRSVCWLAYYCYHIDALSDNETIPIMDSLDGCMWLVQNFWSPV